MTKHVYAYIVGMLAISSMSASENNAQEIIDSDVKETLESFKEWMDTADIEEINSFIAENNQSDEYERIASFISGSKECLHGARSLIGNMQQIVDGHKEYELIQDSKIDTLADDGRWIRNTIKDQTVLLVGHLESQNAIARESLSYKKEKDQKKYAYRMSKLNALQEYREQKLALKRGQNEEVNRHNMLVRGRLCVLANASEKQVATLEGMKGEQIRHNATTESQNELARKELKAIVNLLESNAVEHARHNKEVEEFSSKLQHFQQRQANAVNEQNRVLSFGVVIETIKSLTWTGIGGLILNERFNFIKVK